MRKFNYFSQITPQRLQTTVASVLDVSNVIIIPKDTEYLTTMDEKMISRCMFYHPHLERFTEMRGFRVRLQDAFFNIRENRHLAWVCVEFSKLLFVKLNDDLSMKIMGRTYNSELIVRLYTKEFDVVKTMAHIYKSSQPSTSDYYNQHLEIVRHQSENFGEVCINDILVLYSKFIISKGFAVRKKQPPQTIQSLKEGINDKHVEEDDEEEDDEESFDH